jgi:hypothetical protein
MTDHPPDACTFCGEPVFGILHRKLGKVRTPACKECYKDGLSSKKYTGASLAEKYFWEKGETS